MKTLGREVVFCCLDQWYGVSSWTGSQTKITLQALYFSFIQENVMVLSVSIIIFKTCRTFAHFKCTYQNTTLATQHSRTPRLSEVGISIFFFSFRVWWIKHRQSVAISLINVVQTVELVHACTAVMEWLILLRIANIQQSVGAQDNTHV